MIIKAYDIQDATDKAMEFLKYNDNPHRQIDVVTLQEPVSLLWGLIKRKGLYEIKLDICQENGRQQEHWDDQLSKEGSVQVLDGIIKVTNPIGTGKYATVFAEDPNIDVYINNTKTSNGFIVTEEDSIDFVPHEEQPVTSISIQISQDELMAVMTITRDSGKKYYVEDTELINSLHINSSYIEIPSRRPTLQECVDKLTAENVAGKFINQQAISELIEANCTGSVVAAEGKPPIHGTPGKIKYFFRNESYRNPDLDTDKKVDWLDYFIRPSAKIGDVLAAKVELPIPGRDGSTVTGKVIKAQTPKDIPLISGKGTTLLNEVKVVATMNGRPSLKDGVISVTPAMIIQNNVDAATGKINFDGDIDIKGNVTEGSKILAGGDINVYGNIYGASLYAIGNIRVNGIIMNGKITAGYNVIQNLVVLPKMEKILAQIEKIYQKVYNEEAVNQGINIGKTVFNIVISDNTLNSTISDIREVFSLLEEGDKAHLSELLDLIENMVIGMNALHIKNTEQIKGLHTKIFEYVESIRHANARRSNVLVDYCQNSYIQSSGNTISMGRGSYRTNFISKNNIIFTKQDSVIKGGILIAGKKIRAGIVGSPLGIRTYCRVLDKNGKIETTRCYVNTSLNVNGRLTIIKTNPVAETG